MTILSSKEEILKIINKLKYKKKKIVMCHGVFDVLHTGHINHFIKSKSLGDILIVSITADKYIRKGPNRPFYNLMKRMQMVNQLKVVDYVIPSTETTSINNLKLIKPNIYCKGEDYKNSSNDLTKNIILEKKITNKNNGKIIFTNTPMHSSSYILKSNFDFLNKEQKAFIESIKIQIDNKFRDNFNKIQNLKVLIIGEVIIDEYIYGEAVGKSAKDPIIVLKEGKTDRFLGGATSIAKNISAFSKNVTLLSLFENNNTNHKFISDKIGKSFKLKKFTKNNFKTIVKKRIVESVNKRKLLGLYNINDEVIDYKNEKKIIDYLSLNKKKFDIVIVADYGHGLFSEKISKYISNNFKNSFINCQINSFNYRSQNISKFNKSYCIIINETELRVDLKDDNNKVNKLALKFFEKYDFKILVVTSGSSGSTIFFKKNNNSIFCPAFGSRIVDKTGAGDSLLAIFSICLSSGMGEKLSIFLGSLAAAESLNYIANEKIIDKNTLIKSAENLLS